MLLGHRCICAVESGRYCRRVLYARQRDGILPWFPVFRDVRDWDGNPWRGLADIVCAGFPCQPYSVAGKRQGKDDSRNLWPDTLRCVREVAPRIVFLENVPGLLGHAYFGTILGGLAESGYDAEWDVVPAAAVGAPHLRERLWVLAYANGIGSQGPERQGIWDEKIGGSAADTQQQQRHQGREAGRALPVDVGGPWGSGVRMPEPGLRRMDDGLAHRLVRLAAIGNGQVPSLAADVFRMLAERAGVPV